MSIPERIRVRILAITVPSVAAASYTDSAWRTRSAGRKGGHVRLPDEYSCDLCGTLFLSLCARDAFCPNCGSSQIRIELGYNELSDEDVYLGMAGGNEKTYFIG
jgi:Zn finger protein HypA/HybF involved in hydrogenase expression